MEIVLFLAGLIIGIAATFLITRRKPKTSGAFVMDFSDPLKDVCRLELEEDLNSVYTKKRILLDVKTYDENSQN